MESKRYNVYSKYLADKYGEKVYKLPVSIPVTCPNRDGSLGVGGCIFCGEIGAGFESFSHHVPVEEQLVRNMEHIGRNHNAKKFIAYFQNFTNTYLPLEDFKGYIERSIIPDIVEIGISTRPDCIGNEYLEYLSQLSDKRGINISIELGIQTVNYHTLKKINRGHTLAEFIGAVTRIKSYGFDICAHLILNLPWDYMDDVIENAKIMNVLGVNQIKLHSLYIVKDTVIAKMYEGGEFSIISMDEYIERVITFLEYLSPDIVVQRLIGRAQKENTLFVNWNTSWWKIRDMIEVEMEKRDTRQGNKYNNLHLPI